LGGETAGQAARAGSDGRGLAHVYIDLGDQCELENDWWPPLPEDDAIIGAELEGFAAFRPGSTTVWMNRNIGVWHSLRPAVSAGQ
jgi:hypothetical protein